MKGQGILNSNKQNDKVENKAKSLNDALFRSENKAKSLNEELFSAQKSENPKALIEKSGYFTEDRGSGDFSSVSAGGALNEDGMKRLWIRIGVLMLALIVAFSGAFFGVYFVCRTSILGNSDFFEALMAKYAGIETSTVEVDYITGEYRGDNIELSEKILKSSVLVRVKGKDGSSSSGGETASGSGFVLKYDSSTSEALIITNHHVVYGSKQFSVELYSGEKVDAEIMHLDEISDLAIIKIVSPVELTPVTVADSSKLKYGQGLAVAGNPLGLGFSVSFGSVSCPDRNTGDIGGNLIQLDVSVNPGNSGGGAFDTEGNLIGVVVSKASGTSVDGIGYAIPSNRMLSVVNDLLKFGYVKGRAALGITVVNVTVENYASVMAGALNGYLFNIENKRYGVYVIESTNSTELKKGDRIVSIDGITVTTNTSLLKAISKLSPGSEVKVIIERATTSSDGSGVAFEQKTVSILLQERDWADKNVTE